MTDTAQEPQWEPWALFLGDGEPMKGYTIGTADGRLIIAWAPGRVEADAIIADHKRAARVGTHPWVPDLLVDHDAPVCEVCGEGMDKHAEESLLFQEYMKLEARVGPLVEAASNYLQCTTPDGFPHHRSSNPEIYFSENQAPAFWAVFDALVDALAHAALDAGKEE